MYSGYQFYYPRWSYGMSNDKEARELLVLSHDVAERSKNLVEAPAPPCRNTTEKGTPTDG